MGSLHLRLLLLASLVLAGFLGLGALALDRAFQQSQEQALRERLQERIYTLLGAADEDDRGRMRMPRSLPDPRYSNPDSGLYAEVRGDDGYHWRSFSLVGRSLDLVRPQSPGGRRFDSWRLDRDRLLGLSFGVSWEDDQGRELGYTLAVAESTRAMEEQVAAFRARLYAWLGGVAVLLLLAQLLVLAWGLRPLRRVAADLQRVERGEVDAIGGRYPSELQGLVRNLNDLIRSSRASRDRYRHRLGDLAHSLKTPLALLRGAAEVEGCDELRASVAEQVERMDRSVQYQLRRAAASGTTGPGVSVPLLPLLRRLRATLEKVYRDKGIDCRLELEEGLRFSGDESDLMELLGNLLDNAFKYGRRRVRVGATGEEGRVTRIWIEDDGPGIPPEQRSTVLGRGVRADRQQPGQGIGLGVALEIVHLYGGELSIDGEGTLGGARIQLRLPPA